MYMHTIYGTICLCVCMCIDYPSLAWPDPFRPGAYQLEIISAGLQGSGTISVRFYAVNRTRPL